MSSQAYLAMRRNRKNRLSANPDSSIIGQDINLTENVEALIRETNNNDLDQDTKRNYRNRLNEIMKFWESNYYEYYEQGTHSLSAQELNDSNRFWHKNTRDIKYEGINIRMVLAFLGTKKCKNERQIVSYPTIQKYHDAILFGARKVEETLPLCYLDGINSFLKCYKKETVKAKQKGTISEEEADPIPFNLYYLILQWSLEENNIFVWVFTILQWNFIARSINIGVLRLHNFRIGIDCGIVHYDQTKSDQTGMKVSDKHFYSNPFDPVLDIFGALGVWLALERKRFRLNEDIFKNEGTKEKSASSRYCSQLRAIFLRHTAILSSYVRPDHADSHGTRKVIAYFVRIWLPSLPALCNIIFLFSFNNYL